MLKGRRGPSLRWVIFTTLISARNRIIAAINRIGMFLFVNSIAYDIYLVG